MTFARVALLGSGSYGYKNGNSVSSAAFRGDITKYIT